MVVLSLQPAECRQHLLLEAPRGLGCAGGEGRVCSLKHKAQGTSPWAPPVSHTFAGPFPPQGTAGQREICLCGEGFRVEVKF